VPFAIIAGIGLLLKSRRIWAAGTRRTDGGNMNPTLKRTGEAYLSGGLSRDDLELWLVGSLQEILDSGDPESIAAADAIDADLIEVGEGILTEGEFRERLSAHLNLVGSDPTRAQ
jgi:hypothetical protein